MQCTSGAYILAMVKVPRMNIRDPNNEIVVKISNPGESSGRRNMKPMKNMSSIECLRPILSTINAEKTRPGTSGKRQKKRRSIILVH